MAVESLHGPLHAHSWKLAESGRDRDQSFRPPVPGKTQDRRYWPTAPSNQSLESAHKPPSDHHSVEVHPKTGPTEAKLLNHTVIVLVPPASFRRCLIPAGCSSSSEEWELVM